MIGKGTAESQLNRLAKLNDREDRKYFLLKNSRKRVYTAFIAALYEMERELGELWAHGDPPSALNERQLEYRKIYDRLRTYIFDRGNEQVRGIESDLKKFFEEDK